MEKIKLSDFKAVSRYTFLDNIFSKVKEKLQGKELEFYTLNGENMKPLLETKEKGTDLEFLYQIIPVISNVVADVDFAEFEKMTKYPSIAFTSYYKSLLTEIGILFKTVNQINQLEKETKDTAISLGVELPTLEEAMEAKKVVEIVEVELTTEERLDVLYAELETTKGKIEKREVLKKIATLEVEEEGK